MDRSSGVILVWRRKLGGDELLELPDGKQWRLPYADEIGLARVEISGRIAYLAEARPDFDPGCHHRWVPIDRSSDDVRRAFAQSGAAAIVWRRGEAGVPEILVLHRSVNGADYEGDWAWGPPGGAIDPGETHETCAARELREETGLEVPLVRLTIANDFAAHIGELVEPAQIVLSDEHDRYEWLTVDAACERCAPAVVVDTIRAAAAHIEGR